VVRYNISDYKLVSIIIPTKNLGDVLECCLKSIFENSTYPNYEVIVIDNGSDDVETAKTIASWKRQQSNRFKCYNLDIPFNYSRINNYAASKAKGNYLLFLNNDTEVITPDWIEAMVEQSQRATIGSVGALLLYPDDTVQHAGVILGIGGIAGHGHKHFRYGDTGYISQLVSVNNYSALTAACLMCRKDVFEEVGGFDENLAIAFNDVDLCLKMLQKGYQNVYLPHAALYHYESKSRGYEDTREKQLRFQQEIEIMKTKWGEILGKDPCYSPNLTLAREDYSLNVPIPMVEVKNISAIGQHSKSLLGHNIDLPKSGSRVKSVCFEIAGWLVGKNSPVVTVELLYQGKVLHKAAVNGQRLDVGEFYPEVLWAKTCGFHMTLGVTDVLPGSNLVLQATFEDGNCLPLLGIELDNFYWV
jgi:GT2 family glycosyltransferase